MNIPEWLTHENITVATAVGALIISIYNLITSRRSEKKYAPLFELQKHQSELEIQERLKEIKEDKIARFRVTCDKISSTSYKVKVRNNGKCDAKNVKILNEENSRILKRELEEFNTNVSKISSMSSYDFLASAALDGSPYSIITIEWDDEEKKGKTETFKIKMY